MAGERLDDTNAWRNTDQFPVARRDAAAQPVQSSLLDRLTDESPGTSREVMPTRAQSLTALRAAVRHDLEWLLNTRRTPIAIDDDMVEVRRSLLRYGIPDVNSMSRDATETLARVVREVEATISQFEPRLTNVRVRAHADPGAANRAELRFSIEAMLRVDPAPERVVFDTILEASSGEYQLVGDGSGDA